MCMLNSDGLLKFVFIEQSKLEISMENLNGKKNYFLASQNSAYLCGLNFETVKIWPFDIKKSSPNP